MGNAPAAARANHGAGRSGQSTRVAHEIKESEIGKGNTSLARTAAALHIAGRDNTVPDALSRFSIKAPGGDPYPDRELGSRYRAIGAEHCGPMDVCMTSGDKGLNALCARPRSSASSAFEGPLPSGQLRRFPRIDIIDLTGGRVLGSIKEEWLLIVRAVSALRARRKGC